MYTYMGLPKVQGHTLTETMEAQDVALTHGFLLEPLSTKLRSQTGAPDYETLNPKPSPQLLKRPNTIPTAPHG